MKMNRKIGLLSVMILMAVVFGLNEYADARGRSSSRSSSRSSFSNARSPTMSLVPTHLNPLKRSSVKSTKSSSKSRKMSGSVKKSRATKVAKKKPATFASKQAASKNKSANAHKKYQSKFKKKTPTPKTSAAKKKYKADTKKKYSNNKIAQRSSSYDRNTYDSRRNSYYSGYNAPSYVYVGSSSYGMYDSMFLWMMLSNNNHSFGYHHYNDPGYREWRHEATNLSRDNAELRAQLASMDRELDNMKGQPRNADYLPAGVDADVIMSRDVVDAMTPTLKLCTGKTDGLYYKVGGLLSRSSVGSDIQLVRTNGTMDNFAKVDNGTCDAAIVQRDGYYEHADVNKSGLNYTRVPELYTEYAHLVCNPDSGVDSIDDLSSKTTVSVGPKDSGSALTWKNWVAEDSSYGKVKIVNSSSSSRSLIDVKAGTIDCALQVSGLKTTALRNADATADGKLKLIATNDSDFNDLKDPGGKAMYKFQTIVSNTYPKMQARMFGITYSTSAITVPADLIISNGWVKKNAGAYDTLLAEVQGALPEIRRHTAK